MDWKNYVRVMEAYRARFERAPPSMLTEAGALSFMKRAIADSPARDRSSPSHDKTPANDRE